MISGKKACCKKQHTSIRNIIKMRNKTAVDLQSDRIYNRGITKNPLGCSTGRGKGYTGAPA